MGQRSLLDNSPQHNQHSPSHPALPPSLDPFLAEPRPSQSRLQYPRLMVTPSGKAVMAPQGSPIRVIPPSRSRPQEPTRSSALLAEQVKPAPTLQRTSHSDPGTTLTSVRPAQFLYYHQVPGPDNRGPPIAWNTRELVIRSPPLPRQRSARACKKCRKRKTKVCTFNPGWMIYMFLTGYLLSVFWVDAVHAMQESGFGVRIRRTVYAASSAGLNERGPNERLPPLDCRQCPYGRRFSSHLTWNSPSSAVPPYTIAAQTRTQRRSSTYCSCIVCTGVPIACLPDM